MLVNNTYKNPETELKVNQLVGEPYSILERIKMKGNGSPKLDIIKASIHIYNILQLDNDRNTCNIELRPKGIIISFQKRIETYQLIIPYFKLVVFKADADTYTFYKDQYFIKVLITNPKSESFIQRVLEEKTRASPY